ncbi:HelD family protein [Deinococcus budaensis]|uniref:DNA helicase-2/ATP-dependent DNA helicase PcrA n=1 Tax=Deinococcus budaensis TaxID=1665626 RepID=A0A7W8GI03_9DEIO|nr:UvrD-helicase domain-containing protein [Deinococcus budaensis]MBB5235516.1 DNA helicase-2/ATP-dependent DNA helicase PcrA [Deinococcus budaensis]
MTRHPEHPHESEVLAKTVQAIDTALKRHRGAHFESGGNNFTNRVLNSGLREDILTQLEEFGHEPYFARLDFVDTRGPQKVYFGHAHLPFSHGTVLDWRCDLYSLYLGGNARPQEYRVQATGRTHKVELLLKRRLEIRDRALLDVSDTVDYRAVQPKLPTAARPPSGQAAPPPSSVRPPDVQTDEFLIRKLKTRGDSRLQDIVATIQADQDAIIRAPLDATLLLHGVAGSGKTSIAYHRLAFLMFTEHGYKLKPQQILVIGPNRMFLGYVSDLLPSLGVGGIEQRTFADWAWARMRRRNAALPESPVFTDMVEVKLGEPRARKLDLERWWLSARVRGSLRFRQVLERHVQHLAAHPPLPTREFRSELQLDYVADDQKHYVLTPEEVAGLWAQTEEETPLAQRREQLLSLAQGQFNDWFTREIGPVEGPDEARELRRQRTLIRNHLTRSWKTIDVLEAYEDVFQAGHLSAVARGILSAAEQNALRLTRPVRVTGKSGNGPTPPLRIDLADLPGLFVLHQELYGVQPAAYRHLVVDEAQDFSPLQLQILLEACPNRSATIVGDTAQSIYAYRGIEEWDEFDALLPPAELQKHLIRQNYRSTAPIVAVGNAVQQVLRGEKALLSQAIQRSGPRPRMVALASEEQQARHLLAQIRELRQAGHPSIAVILPRTGQVAEVSAFLTRHQVEHQALTEDQEVTSGTLRGVTVLPAALSKGLEFAAVLVPFADEEHYSRASRHEGHLMYVALSRALHELRLCAVGRFTGWLDQAQQEAEVDYSHLSRPPIVWKGQKLLAQLRETRRQRVPFSEIAGEIALRVETLLRDGQFDEVLEAYAQLGQVARPTLNDLLLLLAERDEELFVRRALDFRVPEALRERLEEAMTHLGQQQCPRLWVYQKRLDLLLSGEGNPAPSPSPAAPSKTSTVTSLPPFQERSPGQSMSHAALKRQLQPRAQPLPKKVRKTILRYRSQVVAQIPVPLRALVEAGLQLNLFDDQTAAAVRTAFRKVTGRFPEELG